LKVPAVPKTDSTAVIQDAVIDPNNPTATPPNNYRSGAATPATPAAPNSQLQIQKYGKQVFKQCKLSKFKSSLRNGQQPKLGKL
jgi:hypothetical protein